MFKDIAVKVYPYLVINDSILNKVKIAQVSAVLHPSFVPTQRLTYIADY